MVVKSTRLRFVTSVDETKLVSFVEQLPFKIEIKGGPVVKENRWFLYFVIPDTVHKFDSINIDDIME